MRVDAAQYLDDLVEVSKAHVFGRIIVAGVLFWNR